MSKKELILRRDVKSNISCLGKKCYQPRNIMIYDDNKITIKKREELFFVYHMFYSKKDKYDGRWYETKFDLIKSLNEKNRSINNKMTFEEEDSGKFKKYKVKIEIFLNEKDWKKLLKFVEM